MSLLPVLLGENRLYRVSIPARLSKLGSSRLSDADQLERRGVHETVMLLWDHSEIRMASGSPYSCGVREQRGPLFD